MKPAAKPYSLEQRPGPEGTVSMAVVYEHRAAAETGQYERFVTYHMDGITPEREESLRRTLAHLVRVGNEGFVNGRNLREFQIQLEAGDRRPAAPAVTTLPC